MKQLRQDEMSTVVGGHDDALLREAAHRLADTVTPYRVLTREWLEELSGEGHWRSVSFDHALQWAVDHGVLRQLGTDLYEVPLRSSRPLGGSRPAAGPSTGA